ncbi:MAG: hypothetical protein K0M67_16365 [Thiobacillus sp.]|nr:hypothetical protein [Thiobacillus sp.]
MDKSRGSHSLLDDASVEAWIAEREPGGLGKLASELSTGRIQGARAVHVADYLHRKASFIQGLQEVEKVTRELRAVTAAERSAKWAGWAFVVSVVALAVSVAALFSK